MRQNKKTIPQHKQKRFVEEYLLDFDSEKAALRAGYMATHAKKWGKQLMKQPHIQTAIRKKKEQKKPEMSGLKGKAITLNFEAATQKNEIVTQEIDPMTQESDPITQEIDPITQKSDLVTQESDLVTQESEVITQERVIQELAAIGFASLADICKWNAEGVYLLESSALNREQIASIAEITESSSGKGAVKIKTHGKLKALEMLAKHLGMFDSEENKETNTCAKPILSPELQEQLDILFPSNTDKDPVGENKRTSVKEP